MINLTDNRPDKRFPAIFDARQCLPTTSRYMRPSALKIVLPLTLRHTRFVLGGQGNLISITSHPRSCLLADAPPPQRFAPTTPVLCQTPARSVFSVGEYLGRWGLQCPDGVADIAVSFFCVANAAPCLRLFECDELLRGLRRIPRFCKRRSQGWLHQTTTHDHFVSCYLVTFR